MKKLMITLIATVAATASIASTSEAQVYDVTLKLKTTSAESASLTQKKNPLAVSGDSSERITYRKQSTTTWKGLIWGCGCESINGTWEKVRNNCGEEQELETIKGCILWDDKTKVPVYIGCGSDLADAASVPGKGFGWEFIHAINKDARQVEGTWFMTQNGNACSENGLLFEFIGSGFGSNTLVLNDGDAECTSYIKSMSGNFAGYMKAPTKTQQTKWSGCVYCGFEGEITCDFAEAWNWCSWNNYCTCDTGIEENLDYTSAYGTWTIKYNSKLSKRMSQPPKITSKGVKGIIVSIRDAYDFSKLPYVEAAIEAVENKIWGIQTPCEEIEDDITSAQASVNEAKKLVDSVSTERLQSDLDAAKYEQNVANTNVAAKTTAYEKAKKEYNSALESYVNLSNTLAKSHWEIKYVNASSRDAKENGTGLVSFSEKVEELKHFTFKNIEFNKSNVHPTSYSGAKKFVDDQTEKLSTLKSTLDNKTVILENAEDELIEANEYKDECDTAVKTATVRYNDRVQLQYSANQALLIANVALQKAEDAYEKAGCN